MEVLKHQQEMEEERQELQRKKEEYQRDLERLRDAQRRLERDKDAVQRQFDNMEEVRVVEVSRANITVVSPRRLNPGTRNLLRNCAGFNHGGVQCILLSVGSTASPHIRG